MRIMLVADKFNSRFYHHAKMALDGHTVIIPKVHYDVISLYIRSAKRHNVDAIILSNCKILAKIVLAETGKIIPTMRAGKPLVPSTNWAGSCFIIDGIKIIISRPFKHLVTTGTGRFLLRWYANKQLNARFPKAPALNWDTLNPDNIKSYYKMFKNAVYIAVDIETTKTLVHPELCKQPDYDGLWAMMKPTKSSKNLVPCIPKIDMIGYCGLFRREDGTLYSTSLVLNIRSMEDVYWMRKFNNLSAPKICQNGGYEATHLIRYNAPLYNWVCDTFHFMHSWYAELPRKLDFITSLFLTDYQYWKDEIESNRAEYNAKDTHNTLWSWVFMVNMAPQWAKSNYLIEFRKCFPAITGGLEGLKVDMEERARLDKMYQEKLEAAQASLSKICWPYFNANSTPNCLALMNALSIVKVKSSDAKALTRFGEGGALEARIAELITTVRGCQKKLSTYIRCNLFDGRLLYEVNHGGTDTGRASSKASNLWVGTNIQNQDNNLRSMYTADFGWMIANCDGSQAESRATGYISEDRNLMYTVETAPDFHKRNASLFFGIPENEITKAIRKLSKRVNHGSNYNMGAGVLLETMGTKNVLEAKRLLGLPSRYGLIDTCRHLLGTFEETYPDVKGKYYDEVIEEISITSMLVGATGWTRYCFDTPTRNGNKPILNKYVAHPPQSLSVMMVDEAEFDFWHEYQIKRRMIRYKAQVHDECFYMVREKDFSITGPALSKLMARPVQVKGRTLIIPNDGGSIAYRWGDLKD